MLTYTSMGTNAMPCGFVDRNWMEDQRTVSKRRFKRNTSQNKNYWGQYWCIISNFLNRSKPKTQKLPPYRTKGGTLWMAEIVGTIRCHLYYQTSATSCPCRRHFLYFRHAVAVSSVGLWKLTLCTLPKVKYHMIGRIQLADDWQPTIDNQ